MFILCLCCAPNIKEWRLPLLRYKVTKYFWKIQTIIQLFSIKKNIFFRVMVEVLAISVPYRKIRQGYWEIRVRYGRITLRYWCKELLWQKNGIFMSSTALNAESRKCGKRTLVVSQCGRETFIVEVLFKLLLLPFYYLYIYYSIIPSLEYLNVHFPTFLLFYFLSERWYFLLHIL